MKKLLWSMATVLFLLEPMEANAANCKNTLFEIADQDNGAILVANVPDFQAPMIMAATNKIVTNFKVNGHNVEYLVKNVKGDQRVIFIPHKNSKKWNIEINDKVYVFNGKLCLGGK